MTKVCIFAKKNIINFLSLLEFKKFIIFFFQKFI